MNIFDVVIVALILLSGVIGLKKGILKEGIILLGTLLVYIIAFSLKSKIGFFLCKYFPFFSFDGLTTLNILVYQLIAFIMIASFLFSIATIIFKLTGIIQKLVDISIILTLPSKILGGILGIIEGYIFMFIILVIVAVPMRNIEPFQTSVLAQNIIHNSPILTNSLGNLSPAIEDIVIISTKAQEENTDRNELALDILKVELDCNIISKEEALELINKGKLNNIHGIKTFVLNYKK